MDDKRLAWDPEKCEAVEEAIEVEETVTTPEPEPKEEASVEVDGEEPAPEPEPEVKEETPAAPKKTAATTLEEAIEIADLTPDKIFTHAVKADEFVLVTIDAKKIRIPRV